MDRSVGSGRFETFDFTQYPRWLYDIKTVSDPMSGRTLLLDSF